MICPNCRGTGKIEKPQDQEKFDRLVEIEMDKAYFVSYDIAMKRVAGKVPFITVDCPKCGGKGSISE